MKNHNIDWSGNCEFDENGKVTGFKVPSTSNHFGMIPIPNDEKTMQDAREADRVLNSVMQPATKDQIAIAIKKLSLHCGLQAKAPSEVKSMFVDYCYDLRGYPKALIDEACRLYRQMPEGNSFMPSSGKLISLINEKYHKMKFMRSRIDKILGKDKPEPKRENKAISLMDALDDLLN